MENLYHVLGVLPTASLEEIKEAYLRVRAELATSGLDASEVLTKTKSLESAFAVLSDSGERANHDRSMTESANSSSSTALTLLERPGTILRPAAPTPQGQQICPYCGAPNPIQASVCLQCEQQMTRPCPNCGQAVMLTQSVCSRCNAFLPEYDQKRLAEALVAEQKTQSVRLKSEAKVQALEAHHRVRAVQGVFFWALVGLGCVSLTVIPILIYNYILSSP